MSDTVKVKAENVNTKTAHVGIRVTVQLNAAIEKAARKTGRSKSNWIQSVIHAALHGGGPTL